MAAKKLTSNIECVAVLPRQGAPLQHEIDFCVPTRCVAEDGGKNEAVHMILAVSESQSRGFIVQFYRLLVRMPPHIRLVVFIARVVEERLKMLEIHRREDIIAFLKWRNGCCRAFALSAEAQNAPKDVYKMRRMLKEGKSD